MRYRDSRHESAVALRIVRLRARILYMNIKLALIIVTLPCLVTGVFSFVGWRHEYLLRQLEQHGQEVQAVVTDSNPGEGNGRRPVHIASRSRSFGTVAGFLDPTPCLQ